MTVKEHAEFGRLLAAVRAVLAAGHTPWRGTIFRSAPPRWASGRDMLTGAGALRGGGRYNAVGSFPVVYGSTTPELAMMESLAFQRRAGLPPELAMPLVFKAVAVEVERALDLTTPTAASRLGVTTAVLTGEAWWLARARGEESLTQAIGRAAHAAGVQALLVPSAQTDRHGHNVVALPDHVSPPSRLRVLRRSVGHRHTP